MSWFKRGSVRKSLRSVDILQSSSDQTPKLEVFKNHWKQAWIVMSCQDKKTTTLTGQATVDGAETVLHNLEEMVTLLANETDDAGLPGPILNYILELEVLEKFCSWCTINMSAHDRLRIHQLRLFELMISFSKQLLLVHKPVIKPLMRLLIDVADSQDVLNGDLEFRLVLVLHQICICISQQNLILESFFSTETDHGPVRFLIFSLLIPYIHREGPVGQKARDALLLIMTLSARHPHIGQYIANHSDFCPVLATGLSGLYSSLPRRIIPPSSEWYAITSEDCMKIPDLQMFLNSLQFSNAVVQVAHPLVRNQLIEFIYSGFLVPVLAPALHQDIPGLPVPLLDTDLFRISREEVMTATAYLDLFIRHVTDPHLLKAVLKFVFTEKYEDVLILDSLLSRISSNSLLSMVTLALFYTMVNLNCEDVMFQLVFRYLVPCTHVMVSQRRSVRDLDLYSKSAEKFLSLRPSCCAQSLSHSTTTTPSPAPPPHVVALSTSSSSQRFSVSSISSISSSAPSLVTVSLETSAGDCHGETNYFEYLHDAHYKLEQTTRACHRWAYFYDGESPAPDSVATTNAESAASKMSQSLTIGTSHENANMLGCMEPEDNLNCTKVGKGNGRTCKGSSDDQVNCDLKLADITKNDSLLLPREKCLCELQNGYRKMIDSKLMASLDSLNSFLEYLNELEVTLDMENTQHFQSIDEDLEDFNNFLITITAETSNRACSVNVEEAQRKSLESMKLFSLTSMAKTKTHSCLNHSEIVNNESTRGSLVLLEGTNITETSITSKHFTHKKQPDAKSTSVYDMSRVSHARVNATDDSLLHTEVMSSSKNHCSNTSSFHATTATLSKEYILPKDSPSSIKSSLNPLYSSSASVKLPIEALSPFKSVLSPIGPSSMVGLSSYGLKKLNYLNEPPNIGPFLTALFARLEGMIGNSLHFNLLLTDVLSRLAAYPQPLLRSFLFSHNLVFQPSVKSLFQVLSSLRQKLDSFSLTVKNFDSLVVTARQNLVQREEKLLQLIKQGTSGNNLNTGNSRHPLKARAETFAIGQHFKEKRKVSLSDLIFRRSPSKEVSQQTKKKNTQAQNVQVGGGYSYTNSTSSSSYSVSSSSSINDESNILQSLSTWNAVYCALILDEFLKELAALSQEHTVLHFDSRF